MATTAIVGEKVGMSQKWVDDKVVPVTVLRAEPMRIVQVKTPSATATARPGHLRPPRRQEAHQARGRSLRQGGGGRRQAARRAASRLGRRLRGRPGDRRRRRRRRVQGRRHRGQPGQGLRRHDEASQLQGPGRQPRQPQAPPGARGDRLVRLPRPGVQGPADVRPHGPRAGHHAQPRGGRVRRRAQPAARQGLGPRPQRRRRRRPQRGQVAGRTKEGEPMAQITVKDPPATTPARSSSTTPCSASSPTCR